MIGKGEGLLVTRPLAVLKLITRILRCDRFVEVQFRGWNRPQPMALRNVHAPMQLDITLRLLFAQSLQVHPTLCLANGLVTSLLKTLLDE